MTGQFDEAFYRNKRAALVSSVILILANASSIHVDKDAAFYIFKISPVGDWTIIFFPFAGVCLPEFVISAPISD